MNRYIIETKNLTKQYGAVKSVSNLNIHVQKGRIYGLLGRNGAGKTTTMRMLLGLTKPTSGEVYLWGNTVNGNEKKLLPRIGSLIESPGFYPNLTATENLRIFATLRGVPNRSAIKEALDLVSSHILSEISLLADDIGIIDHGALLEEESLAGLEANSSKHVHFILSNTAQAARILECAFHEKQFSIQDDHNLQLYRPDLPVAKVITAFVENGLDVYEAHTCEESLEDYFKRVTGGEGIA